MRKKMISALLVALPLAAIGCSSEVELVAEPVHVRAETSVEPKDLLVGAKDGDWCGNSRVGDADYIRNRSIGAFKCAASALCGTMGPQAAIACSTVVTSLLELCKDDPNSINIMWSMISALAQYGYLDLATNPMLIAQLNPQLWAQMVKACGGEAGAIAVGRKWMEAMFIDQRFNSVGNVSKLTYVGLLLSCAEALRGACDLAVNTVYAVQEGWEAWVDPDFKGSIPGCSKSTAVAVTDHTYSPFDNSVTTFNKCVGECRNEADTCGGDTGKACG